MKHIAFLLALLIVGCSFQHEIFINNIAYKQDGATLIQLTKTEKTVTTFGVLSDIHGNVENTAFFVNYFIKKGVDGFLVPGDIADDEKKLEDVLATLSKSELLVFIIPGNHETKKDYYDAIESLQKKNIIDMTKIRKVEFGHATIISLPGYNQFAVDGGFLFEKDEMEKLSSFAEKSSGKKILLSHQIPKSVRKNGIDATLKGVHAGDSRLAQIMMDEEIDVSVGSHIHEAGGQAETREGIFVPQGHYSETLYLNPGSVDAGIFLNRTEYKGLAALLFVNETHAAYEIINAP